MVDRPPRELRAPVDLATVVVAQSIHDVDSSGYDRRRLQSVNAAEAGNNYYYAYLQSTTGHVAELQRR